MEADCRREALSDAFTRVRGFLMSDSVVTPTLVAGVLNPVVPLVEGPPRELLDESLGEPSFLVGITTSILPDARFLVLVEIESAII